MPHGIEINYMYSDLGIALLPPATMQFSRLAALRLTICIATWLSLYFHQLLCNFVPHGIETNYMYSDLGVALLTTG